jgi:hypothetical protein
MKHTIQYDPVQDVLVGTVHDPETGTYSSWHLTAEAAHAMGLINMMKASELQLQKAREARNKAYLMTLTGALDVATDDGGEISLVAEESES